MAPVLETKKLCKSFGALTVAQNIDFRLAAVTRAPQSRRVRGGLGRTFQINTLFRNLPVLDNVALAVAERSGLALRMWRPASSYQVIKDEAMALLATLGLADDAAARVADLPYGKQRLVEIAIALGLKPKVLLLDEPAAGVPSDESSRILKNLENLPSEIAILIIEHDMDIVFRFAKRITVLVQGEVLVEGAPDEIARDKRVHDVYLGEGGHG
jgi:branched-chain amino acid transport system ATP-binding protein